MGYVSWFVDIVTGGDVKLVAEGKLWSVLVLVADGVVIEIDGEAEEFGAVGDVSKRT